ncbi:MAG: hypothetical protein KDN22_25245 [Verrucomicrobiae bacterium]|nr:hypothetical protein [Verrucomicrobiae bacterium]
MPTRLAIIYGSLEMQRKRQVVMALVGLFLGVGLGLAATRVSSSTKCANNDGLSAGKSSAGSVAEQPSEKPLAPQSVSDAASEPSGKIRVATGAAVAILGEDPIGLLDALLTATPGDMASILQRIQRLTGYQQMLIAPHLLGVWQELDAQAAARAIGEISAYSDIRSVLADSEQQRLMDLLKTDPMAAWAQIDENTLGTRAASTREAILMAIAKENPEQALEMSAGSFDAAVFEQIASADPKRALTMLETSPPSTSPAKLQRLLAAIARGWAKIDLDASTAWASENITSPTARTDWLNEILAQHDPAAAIPHAFSAGFVRGPDSAENLGYRLRSWLRDDRAKALAWLDSLPDSRIRNTIICAAGKGLYGPNEATLGLSLLSQLPGATSQERNSKSDAMKRVARIWMKEDAETARNWMTENLSTADATSLISEFSGEWARSDWPGVETWFRHLSPEDQPKAAQHLGEHFSRIDPDAALSWLADLPKEAKLSARSAMVEALPFEKAIAMISAVVTPGERDLGIYRLKNRLRSLDIREFRSLVESDAIDSLGFRSEIEGRLAHFGPEALTSIAPSIQDESLRATAYLIAAKTMARADPDAGRAILIGAVVPEATRQAILAEFDTALVSPSVQGGEAP